MNVLAGLAEGVLDAILEREDDPARDPFAIALERYRAGGIPDEAAAPWRAARMAPPPRGSADVFKRLDRGLLAGVVGYASGAADEPAMGDELTEEGSPTLAVVVGAGGPMPSLELGPDGTWHVSASAVVQVTRRAGDKARAGLASLASRYPEHRVLPGVSGLASRPSRTERKDPSEPT